MLYGNTFYGELYLYPQPWFGGKNVRITTDKTFYSVLFYSPNLCRFEQAILEQWVSTVLVKATAKIHTFYAVVGIRMD